MPLPPLTLLQFLRRFPSTLPLRLQLFCLVFRFSWWFLSFLIIQSILAFLHTRVAEHGYAGEQHSQTLTHRRVSEHSISQERVWHARQHRHLDVSHYFARFWSKRSESKNAIAVRIDDDLHETARLRESLRSKDRFHRQRRYSIGDVLYPSL